MWGYNSISITEPLWGQQLLVALNDWMMKHYILVRYVPYTADIFVFSYPLYLVALYLWGINKQQDYFKHAALYIFFSSALAAVINITIQYFGDKSRPELMVYNKDQLLLSHLPTDPFPSDHAAVSAAIAMATTLWWIRHGDKLFLRLAWFFWLACGAMSVSRIAVAVHRPTDIIVGICVGVLSAWVLLHQRVWWWVKTHLLPPLIRLEKWLFKKMFGIVQ
jgi:undecaprenyl-diphosphatase